MDHLLENVVGILAVMAVFGNGLALMATKRHRRLFEE